MNAKTIFINLFEGLQKEQYRWSTHKEIKKFCRLNGIDPCARRNGEKEYMTYWKPVSKNADLYSYRFYSHFMGEVPYLLSPVIYNYFILHYLNPSRYRLYYSDKNGYQQNYGKEFFPATLLKRINGSLLMDGENRIFSEFPKEVSAVSATEISAVLHKDKVCLKPSVDTDSGLGVDIFTRSDKNVFINKNEELLDGCKLSSYGQNFMIQEAIEQHQFFSQFNSSSVNTLRICTYRSVVDERIHVSVAALRIGIAGSVVDNLNSGGHFVGVDLETGQLGKTTFDHNGRSSEVWNGIDFSTNDFFVPNWKQIVAFAKEIASRDQHMRLLSMDVCIDTKGVLRLIEVNHGMCALGVIYFLGNDLLAGETKNVIEFCLQQQSASKKHLRVIDI